MLSCLFPLYFYSCLINYTIEVDNNLDQSRNVFVFGSKKYIFVFSCKKRNGMEEMIGKLFVLTVQCLWLYWNRYAKYGEYEGFPYVYFTAYK